MNTVSRQSYWAMIFLCAIADQASGQGRFNSSKPLQLDRRGVEKSLEALGAYGPSGETVRLAEHLADANEREDRGSVYFIGSLIIEQAWKKLKGDIKTWAGENPNVKGLNPRYCDALEALNRLADKLERISVGPFLYDLQKEQAMVASTRDRLLLTRVLMKAFLQKKEGDWRSEVPKLDIEFSLMSLLTEVSKLKREVSRLSAKVDELAKGLEGHPDACSCEPPTCEFREGREWGLIRRRWCGRR